MSFSELPTVCRGFGVDVSVEDWTLLDVAIKMTHINEAIIPINSTELIFSSLIRDPRIADQRGLVWKMMMTIVIGINCKLKVNNKKLIVPKKERN